MSLLADADTMIAAGPSATTAGNAISATQAGAPIDYVGMLDLYKTKLKEAKETLVLLKAVTDSGDSNLTVINTDLTAIG